MNTVSDNDLDRFVMREFRKIFRFRWGFRDFREKRVCCPTRGAWERLLVSKTRNSERDGRNSLVFISQRRVAEFFGRKSVIRVFSTGDFAIVAPRAIVTV